MAPIVSLAASTALVVAIGAGAGYAASLALAPAAPPSEPTAPPAPIPDAEVVVTPVPAIVTNLDHPEGTWVRTELSLVSATPLPPGTGEAVAQDLLAYLRTVRLDQVEGPSGFLMLREAFDERAALRTQGRATRVLVRTLLFE